MKFGPLARRPARALGARRRGRSRPARAPATSGQCPPQLQVGRQRSMWCAFTAHRHRRLARSPRSRSRGGRAPASHGIIVKRVAGLDRGERLAVRQDADVKLDEALALPDTERRAAASRASSTRRSTRSTPTRTSSTPSRTCRSRPRPTDPQLRQRSGACTTPARRSGPSGRADADIDAPEAWADDARRGRDRRRRRHRRRARRTPTSPASGPATRASAAAARRPTASTTTTTASSTTGRAGTSSTTTTRRRPRPTSTARTSRARSPRWPTTASASPASRRRPRSCR